MKKLIVLGLSAALLVACGPIKGGDNNNNNKGGDALTYDTPTAKRKLRELGEGDGYQIRYSIDDGDGNQFEIEAGMKANVSWFTKFEEDGTRNGYALKASEEHYDFYDYSGEDPTEIVWSSRMTKEQMEAIGVENYEEIYRSEANSWLFFGNNLAMVSLTQQSDGTMLGRPVEVYTYGFSYMNVASVEYTLKIDKATGVTLFVDASATDQEGDDSVKIEAKSFKTGNQVSVPELPEPTPEQLQGE